MTVIASRDLHNHTRDVLEQVAAGTVVTVTVNGEPAAQITRPERQDADYDVLVEIGGLQVVRV